jgi:hypothetical protein
MGVKFRRRIRSYAPRRKLAFPRKPPVAKVPLAEGGLTNSEVMGWWPSAGMLSSPSIDEAGRALW